MLDWVADWVAADRRSLGKPTKFEVRSGAYLSLPLRRSIA